MSKRKAEEEQGQAAQENKTNILAEIDYSESSSSDEESKGYIRLRTAKPRVAPALDKVPPAKSAQQVQAAPIAATQNTEPSKIDTKSTTTAASTSAGIVKGPKGRDFTVSIALPGSILFKQENDILKTFLAGQIARAAAVFNIDEIVVFTEDGAPFAELSAEEASIHKDPNIFLARILQYLETPQYLRKKLFAQHVDLRFAGMLSPLDATHHLRIHEQCKFREGVIVEPKRADIGLKHLAEIDRDDLEPNTRVTIEIKKNTATYTFGKVVDPSKPRQTEGLYWGYSVRLAQGISNVLAECPFEGGYDYTIGTSERGESVDSITAFKLPKFKHLMIVFGGPDGIEKCVAQDSAIPESDPKKHDAAQLFTKWLNTCPRQGSRTIRTEEAIFVSLSAVRPFIFRAQKMH